MTRLEKLAKRLADEKIDALLVSDEKNVGYISGFTGDDSWLLVSAKENYLITDFRYLEQATDECPDFEIIKFERSQHLFEQLINELVQKLKIKRFGFEKEHVSYSMFENIQKYVQNVEIIPTAGHIEELRYVKDANEINRIKKAAEFADQAFAKILEFIEPGLTEKEVRTELEYYMKKAGADGIAFETILLSGVNTSLPHGKPSDKKIAEGDLLTMDFGALYQGYRSDMTRTIAVGKIDEQQKKIYNIVKEAQDKALTVIKDGIIGKKPDDCVREIFEREGYNEYFGHGLGHGVGLLIHEEPFMGVICERELKENCVVTVEPGIYLPKWGGVRIEDTVVVTKDGCDILTKSPKELIVLN